MPAEDEETLEAQATALFGDAARLPKSDDELRDTILPQRAVEEPASRAAAVLARLSGGLDLGPLIGEGGMGLVRSGIQRALFREVAVKSLRPELRTETATLRLLREAWVTGALEHPNIVPVYDISLADGDPRIVLKKIDGVAWSAVMHDERAIRERFGAHDALEWNVRILLSVIDAVRFAHKRRLVHRDLKPENVMIGAFGEVYVLDWGLALSLVDDGTGRLPLASEARGLAGTPAYMAPEMLGDGRGAISERTDVYLLGAMLFEIVAGRPPHAGKTMIELYAQIALSKPPIPERVPQELRRILRRAMHRHPERRFESAEALRLALVAFLEHRGSLKLAEEASARLAGLEVEHTKSGLDPGEARLRLYHLFGECRFGYLEALRIWPENEEARKGLERATTLMVELELANDDPRAAWLLLAELPKKPRELAQRVDAARRAWQEEENRRIALARDHDPRRGRVVRLALSTGLGIVWTLLPLIGFALETRDPTIDHRVPLTSSAATLIASIVAAWLARGALRESALNRNLVRAVGIVLAGQLALYLATWHLGISYEQTRPLVLLLHASSCAVTAAAIERRLWPAALTYALAAAAGLMWPLWAWPFQAIANLMLTLNVIAIWWRWDEVLPKRESFADFLAQKREREVLRSGEMQRPDDAPP